MKKSVLTILIILFANLSFAQIHYVSNDGSSTGDGSLTNPFDKISAAYDAAVSNGQNEVIRLIPGVFYETNILVFDNNNITIFGYGDQSIISNNIIVKSDMSFADLYIQGSFSNEAFVAFNNVRCDDDNFDLQFVSGMWRSSDEKIHINYLSDPNDELEAINYQILKSLSNYVAETDISIQSNITSETFARETNDNQLSADIVSATNGTMNTVKDNYVMNSGGTVSSLNVYPGRFGVGTTNPLVLFDVREVSGGNGIFHFEGLDGGLFRIDTFAGHVNLDNKKDGGVLYMGRDMVGNGYICMGKSGSGIGYTLVIPTGSNPYAGNIGIGTSTPQAKLDVNGKIMSDQTISGDSDNTVVTKGYVENIEFSSANISTGAITADKLAQDVNEEFVNADGDTMTGTLTINMTENGNALRLLGENQDFKFHMGHDGNIVGYYWLYRGSGSGNLNALELWTQNGGDIDKQVYNIYQDGNIGFIQNVGIGTNTPQSKLHVIGKIKSTQTTSGDSDDTVTTKGYVDDSVSGVTNNIYVEKCGDMMTGQLSLLGAPTNDLHAATKKYVDDSITGIDDNYVEITGDTMTGFLYTPGLFGTDAQLQVYGDQGTGGDVWVFGGEGNEATGDGGDIIIRGGGAPNLIGTGGNVDICAGSSDFGLKGVVTIKDVVTPINPADAATKAYVDNIERNFATNGDWHVGTVSNPRNIIMENDGGMIKTKEGPGNSLRLKADHVNGGQIVMHSPVSMPGMAGKVTWVNTYNSDDGYEITNPNCRADSIVIITPTSHPHPLCYYVTTDNGNFTVSSKNSSYDECFQNSWSFNYLIINP